LVLSGFPDLEIGRLSLTDCTIDDSEYEALLTMNQLDELELEGSSSTPDPSTLEALMERGTTVTFDGSDIVSSGYAEYLANQARWLEEERFL
ncbi:MAG: hypothetical protein AAFO29_01215, partial [Actinomycetota bacterium]